MTWAVLDAFRLHPYLYGFQDGTGQFLTLVLALFVRQTCVIAAMLYLINLLYLRKPILSHFPVFIKCLFKMPADMYQTVDQVHTGVGLEGCLITRKTVALEATIEVVLIGQGFNDRSSPRSPVVMEDDQFFHDRPDHPEIFLISSVLFLVDDRNGGFIRLHIVTGENFLLLRFVQRFQQLYRFLEPSVQRASRQFLHAEVAVLLYLTVERNVILVFLEEDFGKQAGISDALGDGYQRHGSHLHTFLSLGRKLRIVLERIFGTDKFLYIEHSRFVFDNTGYLFAYSAVQGKVYAIRLNHFGFEYRQVFQHFSILPLLSLFIDVKILNISGLHNRIATFVTEKQVIRGTLYAQP